MINIEFYCNGEGLKQKTSHRNQICAQLYSKFSLFFVVVNGITDGIKENVFF